MNKICLSVAVVVAIAIVCLAQTSKKLVSFDQLFPQAQQRSMGLHKLTAQEKEALRAHVESLLVQLAASAKGAPAVSKGSGGGKVYAGVGGGHWIKKNVDSGTYMILEDGSLWQIDPLDKIDAMLWLPISDITVTESSSGSPGFDYLLINTNDGEKAHAKYMGKE
jgi:hypothetical protein